MGSQTGILHSFCWFSVDWLIFEPLSICTWGTFPPFSSCKPMTVFFPLWIFDVVHSRLLPDISLRIYGSYPVSSVRCSFPRVKTAIFQKFSYKDERLGPSLRFLLLILLLIFCYLFAGDKLLHMSGKLAAGHTIDSYGGQPSELGLWSRWYPMRQICLVFRADFRDEQLKKATLVHKWGWSLPW